MSDSIINGLFTIFGTITGGLISYLITKNNNEICSMRKEIKNLTNQIASYWNLEKIYSDEISKLISKPSQTIKLEFREKIESMDFERPSMTEKEAIKILKKYN